MSKAQTKIPGRVRSRTSAGISGLMLASLILSVFISGRPYQAQAFGTAAMTNTGAPTSTVAIGEQDVLIMNFVLPTPATDTLARDGAGASAAGNALTDFSNVNFSDDTHDNGLDYTDGALITNSVDTTITSGEIITTGTADLTVFDTAGANMEIFADNETDDNAFGANEDIYRLEHDGSDVFANDGTSNLEDFAATVMFYDDNTVGDNNLYDDTEAIISDADADGLPTSGDSVVTSGKAGVIAIELTDDVILDDLNSDGDYDAGERIWKDTNASAGSFDAGFDYVLVGEAAATCAGLCTPVSNLANESGLAFLDDNNDGLYTSTRNTSAETIVWFGNAVNPTDGDSLTTALTFFDPAQLADDDINGLWLEDLNAFAATDFHIRTDAEGDGAYADGDDIFTIVHNGSTVSGDAAEVRNMGANDKYSDADNSSNFTDGELIANSADANLAGAEIVVSGTVDIRDFASSSTPFFKFVDDGDATYEDGEDIYQDDDDSGYIDADQLTGMTVTNSGTAVDDDIDELSVWVDDGDGTFETGQDTQVLTDSAAPFFATANDFTGAVHTTGQRIFVSVNIDTTGDADGLPTDNVTIIGQLLDGSAGGDGDCDNSTADEDACAIHLASNDDGPADGNITNANTITIDSIVPTATTANITSTIDTDGGTALTAGISDTILVVWDANSEGDYENDIASVTANLSAFGGGASVAMTEDDGGAVNVDCDGDTLATADVWCTLLTVSAGAVDATLLDATVAATDDAGNVAAAVTDDSDLSVDNIRPTITAAEVQDAGLNGIIDSVVLTFSENLQNTAVGANGFDVTSAANHGTCNAESIDPAVSTAGTVAVTCTTAYTAVGDLNLAFTANAGILDDAGNQMSSVTLTSASSPAITDNADPVLMTVSPASAGTSISRTADIVMTFSEPMTATFDEGTEFAVSADPGAFVDAWTVSNTVVTLTHESSFGCSAATTVTLTPAAVTSANAEAMNTGGPQDEVWSFTTASCSSGGSSGGGSSSSTPDTYTIGLDSPEGGEELVAGDEQAIRWTTGGTGTTSYIDIYYTTDGATYTQIVDNTSNDGVYTWTVPDGLDSDSVMIKIESTDLSEVLDSDLSSEFTVGEPEVAAEEEEAPAEEAEGTGEFGYSPVTGELEEISDISAGDYFRGESYDTVYYLNSDGERRPFMDSQTYFTWRTNFSSVITVTDATLAAYSLGAPMLPKQGVVLIKIVSNPDVFALEIDPDDSDRMLMRLIPDEETAVAVYGDDWADYVIDVDVTLFSRFNEGEDIDETYEVDLGDMKKRVDLN